MFELTLATTKNQSGTRAEESMLYLASDIKAIYNPSLQWAKDSGVTSQEVIL